MPPASLYRPDPAFARLGSEFADQVAPALFPRHVLRRRNQAAAAAIGLDHLSAQEWEAAFARFEPLPENQPAPLAMRYHGHQFRAYNPNIGDGRGFLFAQVRGADSRLLDLATKGSGQTPYSRFGDGRLTLKGGVREVVAAEMLAALGVYTSKALSLFETGEQLVRHDEPSPTRSSVLVRLSHSHLRFGSFQRLAYIERPDLMRALVDHALENYYPQHADAAGSEKPALLLREAVAHNARLAASWMAAGFVHGVLNTDNLNITGESFDYGPWRFLPASQPDFTAAYFDETGLYSFARQPEAVSWALAQFAGALSLISEVPPLEDALKTFAHHYGEALCARVLGRLGVEGVGREADLAFLQALFDWMTQTQCGWDQFFHDWFCGEASAERAHESPQAALYAAPEFAAIRDGFAARAPRNPERLRAPYFQRPTPCAMLIDELEDIWSPIAERNDWAPFETKLTAIAEMTAALRLTPNVTHASHS